MASNLFIAYDLMTPGQNYEVVRDQIKALGQHAQIQYSLFYVHTAYGPDEAYAHVRAVMDANDKLAVINASSAVLSVPDHVATAINNVWNQA